MSKVETLRSAVEYIRALQQLLDEHDAVSAAFQSGLLSPGLSAEMNSMAGSPVSSCSSDDASCDPLSAEGARAAGLYHLVLRDPPPSHLCAAGLPRGSVPAHKLWKQRDNTSDTLKTIKRPAKATVHVGMLAQGATRPATPTGHKPRSGDV